MPFQKHEESQTTVQKGKEQKIEPKTECKSLHLN